MLADALLRSVAGTTALLRVTGTNTDTSQAEVGLVATTFAEVVVSLDESGGASDASSQALSEQMSSLVTQITSLNSAQEAQLGAIQENTQAVTQNTTSKGATGASVGSTIGGVASSVLGGGLSLSPLISGLLSLFGGGGQTEAAPTPFTLPAPVQYQAGLTGGAGGEIGPVSYGSPDKLARITKFQPASHDSGECHGQPVIPRPQRRHRERGENRHSQFKLSERRDSGHVI